MAKKKAEEEHENLERWLVSYADFMTLIFATFVVLYAMSQIDISGYIKLEESIKKSFNTASVAAGSEGMLDSEDSIIEGQAADSVIPPLIMEYLSPKYEQTSFEEIKEELDKLAETDKEFKNLSTEITERGLTIKLDDRNVMFASGSAQLNADAQRYIDRIGRIIRDKFKVHLIRVEGHTDNLPMLSALYPSNWELSSARASSIVRYLIKRFDFNPVLFSAVGLADTRPLADNSTNNNRAQNRRVEIIILRNKYKKIETGSLDIINQELLKIEDLKMRKQVADDVTRQNLQIMERTKEKKKIILEPLIIDKTYEKESQRLDETQKAIRKMFD